MSYHKDDGSTAGGFVTAVMIVGSFVLGYWVCLQGVKVNVVQDRPPVEKSNVERF